MKEIIKEGSKMLSSVDRVPPEALAVAQALTRGPQKPYPKYGDKLMEGKSDMPPNSQPKGPEHAENAQQKRTITPEEKRRIDNAWQTHNALRTSRGEKVSVDELRTQEMIKEKGFMPPLTREAQEVLEKARQGFTPGVLSNNLREILNANGIPNEEIVGYKNVKDLIEKLRENRVSISEEKPQPVQAGQEDNEGSSEFQPPVTPGHQAETGGAGKGGGGKKPPEGPPLPAGEQSDLEPTPESNNEDLTSETKISRGEFVNLADEALRELETREFKPILDRARLTSSDGMREIYEEINEAYKKLHDDLFNERASLQPKDRKHSVSAEDLVRQSEIDTRLRSVSNERDRIIALISSQMELGGSSQASALKKIKDISPRSENEKENEAKGRGSREAIEALRSISTSEGLATELIDSLIEYDGALEYLVNRIISEPLDAETSGYQLSFYGGINFALIRDRMRVASERSWRDAAKKGEIGSKEMKDRPSVTKALVKEGLSLKFEYMRAGAELFHNMNWKIVTGDIEQFVGAARGITIEHLQVLQRVKLAANVMRLYEQELQAVIARDGKITSENYTDVIGTILDKNGNPTGRIQGRVERLIEAYNETLGEDERLEPWQLKWAFYTGRNMMNITLRAAEVIAQSKEIGYKSYTQESASRIIDPTNLTAERFSMAEQRGGLHFLSKVKNIFDKDKKRFGWLENGIKTMYGGDRKEFEARGIFNITGIWSSWRENNIIQVWNPEWNPDPNDPKKQRGKMSIDDFMGTTKGDHSSGEKKVQADALRNAFFVGETKELKPEICHSLGILLRTSELLPNEEDFRDDWTREAAKVKREVRTALWKRIAKENPLTMANFLRGMRIENEDNTEFEKLDDELMYDKPTVFDHKRRWPGAKEKDRHMLKGEYKEKEEWKNLRNKLAVAHERKMKALGEGRIASIDEFLNTKELGGTEKEILNELRRLGEKVAPKMAEVRFPSNPFMNDVLFEDAQYSKAGAEHFRRRLGGDVANYHGAGEDIGKTIDNPGGSTEEEIYKGLREMERSLSGPNGVVSGQDDITPFFEAYIEWTRAGGNSENVPEFIKFFVQESALGIEIGKKLRRRNSWAQVYSGPEAPAKDLSEINKSLDVALKEGILRRGMNNAGEYWTDIYDRLRKKYKTTPLWLFLRFVLDVAPVFFFGSTVELGQKSIKQEGR